jgi:hypothetical protein
LEGPEESQPRAAGRRIAWRLNLGRTRFKAYGLDPLNINPLRDHLEKGGQSHQARAQTELNSFIAATNVKPGEHSF